ncbi:MAG: von Willebrand factor type A domain-containing protein, partial [Myxococcales bacterium]|nr:von Willebrand factor type A domain-containing protein [Myxococcales bacterium]
PVKVQHFTSGIKGVHFGGGSKGGAWKPGDTVPAPAPAPTPQRIDGGAPNRESYAHTPENPYVAVADDPVSTFAADVDTGSFSNARRILEQGRLPPADAVRAEEFINYFAYDYPAPAGDERFAVHTEVSVCPWNPAHYLARIGVKGKEIAATNIPPRNLVFLIDVSGSMATHNKLPLLKAALGRLVDTLRPVDKVAIVVYAGAAGVVLPPTSGADKQAIRASLERLEAGGSTAGGAGIELAYKLAKRSYRKGAVNRVILASDGDFNVGVSSVGELVRLIEQKRKTGVFLTTLGFGAGNLRDDTMEQLADKGDGSYAYIDSLAEAEKVLVREASATLVTIARDVKLQVEFNPAKIKGYRQIGYENRQLADQDFNDDTKDAGELGAGHTVTALYELIPVGAETSIQGQVDPRRYQAASTVTGDHVDELMFVKVRSKPPGGGKSTLRSFAVTSAPTPLASASRDFRFATAVAELAMVLRGAPGSERLDLAKIARLAEGAKGPDPHGDRQGLIDMVHATGQMKAQLTARAALAERGGPVSVLDIVGAAYPKWRRSKRVKAAATLEQSALPVLDRAAGLLGEFEAIRVEVSGHTDDREGASEEERMAIALARAEVVRAYLIASTGIDPSRITTRAAGSAEPVADNKTKQGRAKNRRIEFTVLTQ